MEKMINYINDKFSDYLDGCKKMNKRGLAVSTFIVIIIVIVGLGILLYFYSQVAWTGNIDRSVCHQSVVYRGTIPEITKDLVPLRCKTEKVCITSSFFGKCDEFKGTKGITRVKVNNVGDIEHYIARDVLSCWETMGEGKLTLFGHGFFLAAFGIGDVMSSCVICSRIAFDEENLEKSDIKLEDMDVFNYMVTHRPPNEDVSYYEKILGKRGLMKIDDSKRFDPTNIDKLAENYKDEENQYVSIKSDTDELTVLFMQVVPGPDLGTIFINDLAALGIGTAGVKTGGAFVRRIPGLKKLGGTRLLRGVGKIAARVLILAVVAGIGFQVWKYHDNAGITAGYCGDVMIGDSAKQGCSVVRTMNYNVNDIVQFCGRIESIS